MPSSAVSILNLSELNRQRWRTARRLGFNSIDALDEWEEMVVTDHFAIFIIDYLARGYCITPDKRELIRHVDLKRAVKRRVRMLEDSRFEEALCENEDKSEWTAKDHYRAFIVGVVADDKWLGRHDVAGTIMKDRGWSPLTTTLKMLRYLEDLINEWLESAGDSVARRKAGLPEGRVVRSR
ncbi:hypothetical protein VTJ83DRAFT_3645 [Remersonia thermophila]|uniref:Uncharacterized protein n=1 Tax=Remersonia thermophila TaxID=72144 RepID=A0ABR4DGV8_9PEZI